MSEPSAAVEQQERLDPLLVAKLAQMELERTSAALLNRRDAVEQHQAAEADRLVRLRQWAGAGFGGVPMPETPEQWAAIPEMIRARIATDAPGVARQFVAPAPLPAEVELRRLAGTLNPQIDGPVLEEAGWLEEAAQLRQQVMAERIAAFEEGQRQAAEAAAAQQAAWEQQRLAGEAQANAQARGTWLWSIQSGQPNPLTQQAVALGQLQPGAR